MVRVHVLLLNQHLDEPFHRPLLADADVERLAAAYGTICSPLVLEGVRIYTVRADQHEIVVEVSRRTGRNLERLVAT